MTWNGLQTHIWHHLHFYPVHNPSSIFIPVHIRFYPSKWRVDGSLDKAMLIIIHITSSYLLLEYYVGWSTHYWMCITVGWVGPSCTHYSSILVKYLSHLQPAKHVMQDTCLHEHTQSSQSHKSQYNRLSLLAKRSNQVGYISRTQSDRMAGLKWGFRQLNCGIRAVIRFIAELPGPVFTETQENVWNRH